MSVCGKYMGDNDATCPQLSCVRGKGHPGGCSNVNGDFQVFASPDGVAGRFSISRVYGSRRDAERVAMRARQLLPGFRTIDVVSSEYDRDMEIDYGNPNPDTGMRPEVVAPKHAAEMFARFGW